ncbi:MAG: 50S ribosomal protein L28 [Chloroflexi bacterium]|nr:50S ribosomal protein L28 [Chloroflexota bacterium]
MAKCDICGKKPHTGNNVSHSKRHTRRVWNPNVHRATLYVDNQARQLYVCAACLKSTHRMKTR